jgi:hypothetical protein
MLMINIGFIILVIPNLIMKVDSFDSLHIDLPKFDVIYLDEEDDIKPEDFKVKIEENKGESSIENKNEDKGKGKSIVDNIRYKPAEEGETFESRHKGKFMDRFFNDLYKSMNS